MSERQRQKHAVASVRDIPAGERKLVEVKGRSIGVFNVNGQYLAVLNLCPHELAPLCLGRVSGTTLPSPPGEYHWGREGEILFCPWHGWEFDLLSGDCLTDRRKHLTFFPVSVEEETVFIEV
jgi:3-phenylpropionate/trans-cinnamate dioxygenase ferredoxin subunit